MSALAGLFIFYQCKKLKIRSASKENFARKKSMNEKYYSKKTRSPAVVQLYACNRIGYGVLGKVLEVVRTNSGSNLSICSVRDISIFLKPHFYKRCQ